MLALIRCPILVLLSLVVASVATYGQQSEPTRDETPAAAEVSVQSADSLRVRMEEAKSNMELPEGIRSEVANLFQQAIDLQEETTRNEGLAASYRKALGEAGELTLKSQQQRQTLPTNDASLASLKEEATKLDLPQLEQRIAQERARLAELKSELSAREDELLRQETVRPDAIPKETKSAREALAAAETALAQLATEEVSPQILQEARRAKSLARKIAATKKLDALQQEQLSREPRLALLTAQRDLLRDQVRIGTAGLAALQALGDEQRRMLSEQSRQIAEKSRTEAEDQSPFVRDLADELAERSNEYETLTGQITALSEERKEAAQKLASFSKTAAQVDKQLAIGGVQGAFAQILIEERRALPNPRQGRASLKALGERLSEARAAAFQVDRRLRELPEVQEEAQANEEHWAAAEPILENLKEVLTLLRDAYRRLGEDLVELSATEMEYRDEIAEYRNFLGDQLFWAPSSPILGPGTFVEVPAAARALFSVENLQDFVRAMTQIPRQSPWQFALVAAICLGLTACRRKMHATLNALAVETRRTSSDRWAHTGAALALTVGRVLPLPLFLGYLGWKIYQLPSATDWLQGVADALIWSFIAILSIHFTHQMARRNGLGEGHFGWKPTILECLRSNLELLFYGYVPLILLAIITVATGSSEAFNSLGRLLFIAAMIWVAWVGKRITDPRRGVLSGLIEENPGGWVDRYHGIWPTLAVGLPVALALLAASGYYLTAFVLNYRFQLTACWLIAGPVALGLAVRAFNVKERKIALERILEERRQKRHAQTENESVASEEIPGTELAEPEIDLKMVSAQTRSLLRFLVGIGVVAGIWFAWLGSAPALRRLDSVVAVGGITVAELLGASLLTVITIVCARNLPGILELALARTLPVDAGSRKAFAKLIGYVVVAIGISFIFQILNVDWSRLGWIVAALSVGLGFGLQEVVANFVSGIILLFERPIRVGDIVTIGEVTGTVSRIQIRATTITDWDRKEFVVPNKEFITGTLKNWTLTDTINRIVIPVGVAYGSDTDKVTRLLEEIAASHPATTEDPKPMVAFEAFGDSALNLVLRCYLPTMENRLLTTHELHSEIHRRFVEEGIEIAFPQMDLHLRSVDPGAKLTT